MKAKDWFKDFGRGASLGLGILPGVSVGTVGIIVDIYDKLIVSIDGLRKNFKKSFLVLLPIALGCLITALALLIFWQKVARPYFPFIIISVLAGFIVGSLPIILKEIKSEEFTKFSYPRVVIGFAIAASIGVFSFLSAYFNWNVFDFNSAFMDPFAAAWVYPVTLLGGFLAAVACLIPGISGSMVLFIFGLYNPIVGIFISQRDANGNILYSSIIQDHTNLGARLLLVLVLLIGIIIGFLAVSKAMKTLLANHRQKTFEVVLGFVMGSVVSMFVNNDMCSTYADNSNNWTWQFIVGGILFVVVAILVWILVKKTDKTKENE